MAKEFAGMTNPKLYKAELLGLRKGSDGALLRARSFALAERQLEQCATSSRQANLTVTFCADILSFPTDFANTKVACHARASARQAMLDAWIPNS